MESRSVFLVSLGAWGHFPGGGSSFGVHNSDIQKLNFTKLAGLVEESQGKFPCNLVSLDALGAFYMGSK